MKEKLSNKTFLVMRRKDYSFEVPDSFPENQIPNFISQDEFDVWYKKNKFKKLKVYEEDYDFNDEEVLSITSNQFDFTKKSSFKILKEFFTHLEKNQRYFGEGNLFSILAPLYPMEIVLEFLNFQLPIPYFEKLKNSYELLYPKNDFVQDVQEVINITHLDKASDTFIAFLEQVGVMFKGINFWELAFDLQSEYDDACSHTNFDDAGNPIFSIEKTKSLIKICSAIENQENISRIVEKMKKLIHSKQFNKFEVIISDIPMSEKLKEMVKKIDNIPTSLRKLI